MLRDEGTTIDLVAREENRELPVEVKNRLPGGGGGGGLGRGVEDREGSVLLHEELLGPGGGPGDPAPGVEPG